MYKAMPRIGYGCTSLTRLRRLSSAQVLFDYLLDLGLRYFDTARSYGRGYSEIILGTCLKKSVFKRDEYLISTKLSASFSSIPILHPRLALPLIDLKTRLKRQKTCFNLGLNEPPKTSQVLPIRQYVITKNQVADSFFASLHSLQTDYIDVYLLHEAMPHFLTDEALAYLLSLRQNGSIRFLGVAANGVNYFQKSSDYFNDWDILQYEFGQFWPLHNFIIRDYPRQHHVYHSLFHLGNRKFVQNKDEFYPTMLKSAYECNPTGTVLFSSLNLSHIAKNIDLVNLLASS